MKTFKLDRVFFRRFWLILKMMYPSLVSAPVFLTAYILVISALDQVLTYYLGIVPSKFYVVIGGRDKRAFNVLAWKSTCIVIAKCLVLTTLKYASATLYVHWRRLLCQQVHTAYFKSFAYYEVNVLRKENIDNADQRIAQDVDKTCRVFSDIFPKLLTTPFIIAYYTYLTFDSSGYLGPLAIYSYFILGTVLNKFLMTPIISLVVEQERCEGNFRFQHMSVRTHAEAIGFYRSGPLENYLANEKLEALVDTQQRLMNWQFPLTLSTNIFDYFGGILSYFIIAIAIFVFNSYDDVDPINITGILSQNGFFYIYLINGFSTLIDMSGTVSDLAGTTHRVAELIEYLRQYHKNGGDGSGSITETSSVVTLGTSGVSKQDGLFIMNSVSYKIPNRLEMLINDLCLQIQDRNHLLITGESSSGKTSVLRVLCGLWKPARGDVICNVAFTPSQVMFLPQKPYFPSGSLRQQVVYPHRAGFASGPDTDEKIMEALFAVRLDHLVERCGGINALVDWDWQSELSPGEMQRLSMARVFYHRPRIVFLDEATSAVGSDMEERVYLKLNEDGITYATVGHRRTLRRFHVTQLHLDGQGGWALSKIEHSEAEDQENGVQRNSISSGVSDNAEQKKSIF